MTKTPNQLEEVAIMSADFRPDFLFGAATAATQVEGGDHHNTWYAWARKPGRIKDGTTPARATDHWHRYPEDFDLLAEMGLTTYRLGLEWSRIEPQPGVFNKEAMAHYRDMLLKLQEKGIEPLVTLFHFSLPLWFARYGGFEQPESVTIFERYVRFVVGELGDLVSQWITINEPNVYAVEGFYFGHFPPGKKDFPLTLLVLKHLALAHIKAYRAIHEGRIQHATPTMVGVAHHVRVFEACNKLNLADHAAAKTMKYLFQDAIIECMATGTLVSPIGHNAPLGTGCFQDFIGINYYTRSAVSAKGFSDSVFPNTPVNDLGWEIYPKGLYSLCKEYFGKYKLPIYITENGVCDKQDSLRANYLIEHLRQVSQLVKDGVDVRRYYHWTLTDNFEWLEGESACFGLVAIDYETQERRLRPSGKLYGLIAKTRRLP